MHPPAPCGAGPRRYHRRGHYPCISIHPPHAGRDKHFSSAPDPSSGFQSTRPVRGGTNNTPGLFIIRKNFNPPAPCGAGQSFWAAYPRKVGFQSTRPVRGGTAFRKSSSLVPHNFNPPAPCGAGLRHHSRGAGRGYFNPPAPCGAGPGQAGGALWDSEISIHPPRAGRDI